MSTVVISSAVINNQYTLVNDKTLHTALYIAACTEHLATALIVKQLYVFVDVLCKYALDLTIFFPIF